MILVDQCYVLRTDYIEHGCGDDDYADDGEDGDDGDNGDNGDDDKNDNFHNDDDNDLRGLTVHTPPQISQKFSSTVVDTF